MQAVNSLLFTRKRAAVFDADVFRANCEANIEASYHETNRNNETMKRFPPRKYVP